jgi:hypothetical protein
VSPGEDNVGTLGGERKMIFDQHLDIAKTGIGKVRSKDWKAALPRGLLGGRRTPASPVQHLLQQLLHH